MAKYYVHICATNGINDDIMRFPYGTGRFGEGFDTFEELVALMKKYATFSKDGKPRWCEEIRLSFELGEMVEGPFDDICIAFRPYTHWVDKNGNEFKFYLLKDGYLTPKFTKLEEILKEIGIEF